MYFQKILKWEFPQNIHSQTGKHELRRVLSHREGRCFPSECEDLVTKVWYIDKISF